MSRNKQEQYYFDDIDPFKEINSPTERSISNNLLRSNINPNLPISKNSFVLSIIRDANPPLNADDNPNPEHAFLLLEGPSVNNDKIIAIRYDLVMDNREGKKGLARIINRYVEGTVDEVKVWCEKNVTFRGNEIRYISHGISRDKASELRKAISIDVDKEGTKDQIRYKLTGINNASNRSSFNWGHNCFTWARDNINNLKIKGFEIPKKWEHYLAAVTSRSIGPVEEQFSWAKFVSGVSNEIIKQVSNNCNII